MRDYRWRNIEHIYECEKESSKLTLENDMQSLLDKYKQSIANEIQQLEENRRQFLVDYELHQMYLAEQKEEQHSMDQENMSHGISHVDDQESAAISPGYNFYENGCIVYMLNDQEVLEDLSVIKMHNELRRCAVSTECWRGAYKICYITLCSGELMRPIAFKSSYQCAS